MKLFRLIVLAMATILMVTLSAFGRIKPVPIDAEAMLEEYLQIMKIDNAEEEINKWAATKSESELASLPIVLGFVMLNQMEGNVLTDSTHYNSYLSAVTLIEKGVSAIEKSGMHDTLYLTTADAGLIPVRYILANAYDKAYKYVEADSIYVLTADEIGKDFGKESEEFVFWSNQCAESLQRKNKNYEKAISLLLPAKEAALHSPEVSDSTACEYLISLAQKYQRSGNHNEAKHLAHEAEKRMGKNHRLIFCVSNTLGELYWIEGNHDTGYSYFKKAEANAPSLGEFFAAGVNSANILRQTGFVELAETTLLALEKYLTSSELGVDNIFNYYESLGVLYTFSNPEKSAEYFRKAEECINWLTYPEVVRHILNSQVYPGEGNSFKIISALDRAEAVFNMLIGDEPRLQNELLMQKGYYLMKVRDYKTSRKYLEAAYLRMLDYAPGDPQLLIVLRYLVRLDEIEGEDIRRGYYLDELLRNAKLHGESSNAYIDAIADRLHFHLQIGNLDGAKYNLDIYRKHRPNDFDTRCYEYRLKLLEGKFSEAEKMLDSLDDMFPKERSHVNLMRQRFYASRQSPKITGVATDVFSDYRSELMRQLLFMSNNERRNMDKELRSRRDEVISAIKFAPELSQLALDYSLFSKGLLFHTQNEILGQLDDNDSAKMEIAKIHGIKAELTRAINSADKELAHSLQQAIDSRERYLIDDYLNIEKFNLRFERYNTATLLMGISPKALMIDFVEYVDAGKSSLGCFIIEYGQPVNFVAIGEMINQDKDLIGKKIWSCLSPYVKHNQSIYFSTDGILNTIPIEFAEDEDGVPMCEKYDLHRVFHLSDIRKSEGIGNRVEAIGVADHNSPNGQARGLDDGYRGNWNDLAGVETELYRIAESLDGVSEYHRAFNDEATEAYVKSLSGQPITTLHISTHGFYRGEDELTKAFNDTTDFDHNIAKRLLMGNRTSASGLVMRNGNLSWKAEAITEDEDNILTSEEVETLTFPKLNLTVLSACETGLGELSADGVWGLQRAFRIAGTGALICSLRQIKDIGAADFMAEFYTQAAKGMDVHDAFYNARKELLSHDLANKEVWSSFILIE